MKKIVFISLCVIAMSVQASENQVGAREESKETYRRILEWQKQYPGTLRPLSRDEEYLIFEKDNLPKPYSGAKIVPTEKLPFNTLQIKSFKSNLNAMKSKGYIDKYNKNAVNLLTFKSIASEEFQKNKQSTKDDTSLKADVKDLKIAYDYHGVPNSLIKETLGFAPEGTFLKNGWTGVIEFFVPKNDNFTCSYRESNIKLTGSAAYFAEENVTYSVNNKVTLLDVIGNKTSGFSYKVEWWGDEYRRILECAHKKFNPDLKNEVLKMANTIDQY